MPREIITIQVGQCGNQIGLRFWDLALREHASRGVLFDDSMSSFFTYDEANKILKARAIIVDLEEGVINQLLKSDIGSLFDTRQLIKDVSGAGNNWANGFYEYGKMYTSSIVEKVRRVLEDCDSPQCFMLTHSIGGGTGSGLGSFILKTLGEEYDDIFKFTISVFPSKNDDVVTSPYNAILSLNQLIQHADCVLPIDNQSLLEIVENVEKESKKQKTIIDNPGEKKKNFYEKMNSIISHLLSDLTCSMRFEGTLNVDINDITMNLVPFPRQHFILSALSPLYHVLDKKLEPRRSDQIFSDVFNEEYQLIKTDNFYNGTYLACALIARGNLTVSDLMVNIEKKKNKLKMVTWNHEGFKIGLCDQPPVSMKYGLLCLSNHTSVASCFKMLADRFRILYKHKAYIQHYYQFMPDKSDIDKAIANVEDLIYEYENTSTQKVNALNQSSIVPVI